MTLSTPVIDELAAALGFELPQELRAAMQRIEAGERGGVTPVTASVTAPAAGVSKAAMRTRRWREKQRLGNSPELPEGSIVTVTAASPAASPTVTESVTVTSPVTVRDEAPQKNFPPHPPIRKYKNTKRGVTQRHRVTVPEHLAAEQVEVEPSDPLYREITAMRGGREPFVGKRGVAWVSAGEIAVARSRMAGRVTALRPSTMAMHAAIGPPAVRESG